MATAQSPTSAEFLSKKAQEASLGEGLEQNLQAQLERLPLDAHRAYVQTCIYHVSTSNLHLLATSPLLPKLADCLIAMREQLPQCKYFSVKSQTFAEKFFQPFKSSQFSSAPGTAAPLDAEAQQLCIAKLDRIIQKLPEAIDVFEQERFTNAQESTMGFFSKIISVCKTQDDIDRALEASKTAIAAGIDVSFDGIFSFIITLIGHDLKIDTIQRAPSEPAGASPSPQSQTAQCAQC